MASHTYTDPDGKTFILYSDENGNITHYERCGEDGGERVNSGDEVSPRVNTERVFGLSVDSVGIDWLYNATKLSLYGFALMGGSWLSTKTPMVPVSVLLFILGTFCIVTAALMYVLSPIPLACSYIANAM